MPFWKDAILKKCNFEKMPLLLVMIFLFLRSLPLVSGHSYCNSLIYVQVSKEHIWHRDIIHSSCKVIPQRLKVTQGTLEFLYFQCYLIFHYSLTQFKALWRILHSRSKESCKLCIFCPSGRKVGNRYSKQMRQITNQITDSAITANYQQKT